MSKEEFFAACSAPLESAYGPMDGASVQMYYSFLKDISPDALSSAVAKCIVELKWLPKIAEIRQAAIDIARGDVQEMSASEAWGHAHRAIRRIDPEIPHTIEVARQGVPALVWEAMRNVGVLALINSEGSWGQKLFTEAYLSLLSRERKLLLAPPTLRREIEANKQMQNLPAGMQNPNLLLGDISIGESVGVDCRPARFS